MDDAGAPPVVTDEGFELVEDSSTSALGLKQDNATGELGAPAEEGDRGEGSAPEVPGNE